MALWSEKMLKVISILLNLLRLVLCSRINPNQSWSILENVPCVLEKNVYSDFFGFNIPKISIKSNCSIVSFKISVALLVFCPKVLSTEVNGVLKSPTIIVFPFTFK